MRQPLSTLAHSGRIRFLAGLFLVLFAGLLLRLGSLQVASSAYYKSLALGQHSLFTQSVPLRGEIKILDPAVADPIPVATNIEAVLVYAVPRDIADSQTTAKMLSPALNLEETELLNKFSDKTRVYVPLKRRLLEKDKEAIQNLHLSGIRFDTENIRYYPEKQFLSHLVGFLGYSDTSADTRVGVYGLEREYEQILSGSKGGADSATSLASRWLFGPAAAVQARNGNQLMLTIDHSVQLQAEEVLNKAVTDNLADGGCVIVMEPKTGAILAMASSPAFDPNEYNKVEDQSVFANSCTSGNYEPGSVFKAITMAAGLDTGKVGPDTTYTDTGAVVVSGYTIKNSDNKSHGTRTMTQVLEESLNTGVIYVKEKIGNSAFVDYVRRFGFGELTGVDVPETTGDLENLKSTVEVNFDTASFGQGILVTPLQLVRSYAAIANGGRLPKPHIVSSQITPDGHTVTAAVKLSEPIISTKTATTLSAMLVSVVERGHGKRARVPGYFVAGKTGTAQVAKKGGGGYDPNNNIGTFVGFAPVEDPKFVMLVKVDHPRTVQFAESTAAPAWGRLAQFLLTYLNVPPNRPVK